MSGSSKSFQSRLDWEAVRELKERALPQPVDALNLVTFSDEVSYRWYGILLAPRLLLLGVRPVWVATHEQCLLGDKYADEIVIIQYPNHRVLLDAVTGWYYGLVNRFRERGVQRFEFSLTERCLLETDLKRQSIFLVAHFNAREREEETSLPAIRQIVETDARRLVYASREVGTLAVFRPLLPSDPNPARYRQTAVFSIPDIESINDIPDDKLIGRLREMTKDLSLQLYRRLTNLEAMPWSKRRLDKPA